MKPSTGHRVLPNRWTVDAASDSPIYSLSSRSVKGRWTLCGHCRAQFPTLHKPGVLTAGRVRAQFCSNRCSKLSQWSRSGRSGNQDAFSSVTAEEAWLIGLIWADGCLVGNRHDGAGGRVELDSVDLDMATEAARIVGSTVREKQQAGRKPIYRVTFSGNPVDRLEAIGLEQRKSFTAGPPDLADGLVRHFIRGLFDGDGTVGLYGPPQRRRLTSGVVGNHQMMAWAASELSSRAGTPTREPYRHSSIWGIRFNHYDSLRLADFLYGDGGPHLARKRDLFTTGGLPAQPRPGS